jgi:hypothetical protein
VEQCFSLTANQLQPAYKPKNSLPNRASADGLDPEGARRASIFYSFDAKI